MDATRLGAAQIGEGGGALLSCCGCRCWIVATGRERRIKRAIDVSLKKKYLPAEVQAVQQPMNVSISAD